MWICKCGAHFFVGIDPSNKNNSNDSDNENKNKRTKPNYHKTNAFMHLMLPLIFKKSTVTIIYTEAAMGSKLTPASMICRLRSCVKITLKVSLST